MAREPASRAQLRELGRDREKELALAGFSHIAMVCMYMYGVYACMYVCVCDMSASMYTNPKTNRD